MNFISRSSVLLSKVCKLSLWMRCYTSIIKTTKCIEFEDFVETLPEYDEGIIKLDFKKEKGIAIITMDNPKSRNAMTGQMIIQFSEVISKLSNWKDGKVAILMGSDNQFSSGGDLKNLMNHLDTPELGYLMSCYVNNVMKRFTEIPYPTLAIVQGQTLGGGAELVTGCDFRIMQENSELGFVQSRLGITPGFGGSTRLTRIVGKNNAMKLLISGQKLTPQDALDVKLMDTIFPRNVDSVSWAISWLERQNLLRASPQLIQKITKIVYNASDCDLEDSYSFERDTFKSVWRNDEHNIAISQNIKHR